MTIEIVVRITIANDLTIEVEEIGRKQDEQIQPLCVRTAHPRQHTPILPQTEKVIKMMRRLASRGETTPTARDVARQMHGYSDEVESILESLVQEGIVQSIQGRQGLKYMLVSSPDIASS